MAHPHPQAMADGIHWISLARAVAAVARDRAFLVEVGRRALGRPLPDGLRGLPCARRFVDLVCELWAGLIARMDHAIDIEEHAGGREVCFLETLIYRRAAIGGPIATVRRLADGLEQPESIDLGTPLCTMAWVDVVLEHQRGLLDKPRSALTTHLLVNGTDGVALDEHVDEMLSALWAWALRCLRSLVRRSFDIPQIRRALIGSLALDADLVRLARRARPTRAHLGDVSSAWDNRCLAHRR